MNVGREGSTGEPLGRRGVLGGVVLAMLGIGLGLALGPTGWRPWTESDRASRETAEGMPIDAGPDVAARLVDRLQLFRTGEGDTVLELESSELTALLRHAVPGLMPAGVREPLVHVVDDEIRVRALVSPALLPSGRYLTESLKDLPSVVDVELRGRLVRPSASYVDYRVEHASVQGLALPRRLVRLLVTASGGRVEGEGPAEVVGPKGDGRARRAEAPAFRAPWPLEHGRIVVHGGVVRIERVEPMAAQLVDGSDDP
ncbi:MAG: hypothetical protein AMS19_05760 [Gemmatimonas sp. SG8_23]|jgi:hypothetical protein|nr:MAG: hypothetical protein AMS19_05760 [Gemmatimonas sp. SG8_23]